MNVLEEKRNGVSLAECAAILATHSSLKLEHGEPGFRGPWQQYLREQGLSEAAWANAWNTWWQALEADSGLAAKYHTYASQLRMRQMTAGQADVSQDMLDGVTLEQFARICANIQGGADAGTLIAGEGLTMDQWQRGQAAWGQKMGTISPTDPIMLQYAMLYQKYNATIPTAAGAVSMEQATEQVLDRHAQIHGNVSLEATVANAESEFFASDIVRHKARGVRQILNLWDRTPSDDRASDARLKHVTRRAFEISVDLLQNGPGKGPGTGPGYDRVSGSVDPLDIHAWGAMHTEEEAYQDVQTVVSVLKDLAAAQFMTPAQSAQGQEALAAAIERLAPRKDKVEALFRGTKDVTKKSSLRTLLDDYTGLLNDLQEAIDDWSYEGPEGSDEAHEDEPDASTPVASSTRASASRPAAPSKPTALSAEAPTSPLIAFLKGLPVIGPLLVSLGIV